jgi:hypothetical protein
MKINKGLFTSYNTDERTPKELYKKLNEEFNFDMDAAPLSSLLNTLDEDFDWKKRVYCNPPYNNQDIFIKKALKEIENGHTEIAVFLLPSRTDTKRFHELVLPNAKEIRFIKGRLKFSDHENNAPFPSMIVVF